MAIITTVQTDYNVTGTYVKVDRMNISGNRILIIYSVYKDKESRINGASPLANEVVNVPFDVTNTYNGNVIEIAYSILKEHAMFENPVDDIDI